VQGVDKGTAEEFFSRLLTNAQVLHEASVRAVEEGDLVTALACTIGSDAATLESRVWERLNIAPRSPQRQFFQAIATVASSVDGLADMKPEDLLSADRFVQGVRVRMLEAFDDALAADVADHWGSLAHLSGLPMLSGRDMEGARAQRLEDLTPAEFIKARRTASGKAMLNAQSFRVRGAIPDAIQAAYESDFLAMEAYLVESALAVGDGMLFTSVTRRILVTQALGDIAGLPSDFTDAVAAIRDAMADGLGEADGVRLRAALIDLP
jgi:hypothetical protein